MAEEVVGIKLNKSFKIRCSDWEAPILSEEQREYAAMDAAVAVKIYQNWIKEQSTSYFPWKKAKQLEKAMTLLERQFDVPFIGKQEVLGQSKTSLPKLSPGSLTQISKRGFATRQSPLYHNCFMHAPDGELLCSCDQK